MIKTNIVEHLIDALKNKERIIIEIAKITINQNEVLIKENLELLNELVDKKQKLIDEANEVDNEFYKNFELLKKELKINKLDDLNEGVVGAVQLKIITKKIMDKGKEILILEEENKKLVNTIRDNLSVEIKKINHQKNIDNAYNRQIKESSYYIDKKK